MNSKFKSVSYPGKIDIPYDKLYAPEIFGRVSFPHRDPKTKTYLREDKGFIFSIESGYRYNKKNSSLKPYGIPFGIYPRLLLLLITSYAIHKKQRKVILSESITGFMRAIGYDLTGGKTGTLAQLNNQLERLLNCRICLRRSKKYKNDQIKKTKNYLNQISRIELWESGRESNSERKIKAIISESYYKWIQETAYPVDCKTVEALRSSLLTLDLYLFLCSRTYRINPKKYETYISWASLEKQLGTNYTETKQFAHKAREAIRKITEWYPQLNVRFEYGCLVLIATSKPHIKSYPQK